MPKHHSEDYKVSAVKHYLNNIFCISKISFSISSSLCFQ